jgi:predicted metal-binding protein
MMHLSYLPPLSIDPLSLSCQACPDRSIGAFQASHVYRRPPLEISLNFKKVCGRAGIPLVICHGRKANVVKKILNGEKVGTLFNLTTSR